MAAPRSTACGTPSSTARWSTSTSSARMASRRRPTSRVELRLPTYWCAPNFAYLMVADARAALEALPGRRAGRGRAGRALRGSRGERRRGRRTPVPASAFPDQADGGPRRAAPATFRRKAFLVRQEPVPAAPPWRRRRARPPSLGDWAPGGRRTRPPREWAEYLVRRRELGMPDAPGRARLHGRRRGAARARRARALPAARPARSGSASWPTRSSAAGCWPPATSPAPERWQASEGVAA